jgi:hypothetical protein
VTLRIGMLSSHGSKLMEDSSIFREGRWQAINNTIQQLVLAPNPPNVLLARQALEGARHLDIERGTGTAAAEALEALGVFEATPPDLQALIQEAPDTVAGTGTVE